MHLLLLSRRHRQPGASCSVCRKWKSMGPTARFITDDEKRTTIDICPGCLREAVKVAMAGRKAQKR